MQTEIEKVDAASKFSEEIMKFLLFLSEKNYVIAEVKKTEVEHIFDTKDVITLEKAPETNMQLIAEFYNIDLQKYNQEKDVELEKLIKSTNI